MLYANMAMILRINQKVVNLIAVDSVDKHEELEINTCMYVNFRYEIT